MNRKKGIKSNLILKTIIIFIALLLVLFVGGKNAFAAEDVVAALYPLKYTYKGNTYNGGQKGPVVKEKSLGDIKFYWNIGYGENHTNYRHYKEWSGWITYGFEKDNDGKGPGTWSYRRGYPERLVEGNGMEIACRHVAGSWYYVVDNPKSVDIDVQVEFCGPANTSANPGKLIFTDTLKPGKVRMYVYEVFTANSSEEISMIGSVDLTLDSSNNITKTGNFRTLAAISHSHAKDDGKGVTFTSGTDKKAGCIPDVFGKNNYLNFKVVQSSKQVKVRGTEWTQGGKIRNGTALVSFDCAWQGKNIKKVYDNRPGNDWYKISSDVKLISSSTARDNSWHGPGTQLGRCTITILEPHGGVVVNKYISKVKSASGTLKENTASARKDMTTKDKKKSPVEVELGDKITYKIEVTNNFDYAVDVKVKDLLPKNCKYLSPSTTSLEIPSPGPETTAAAIKIEAESTVTLEVVVQVTSGSHTKNYDNDAQIIGVYKSGTTKVVDLSEFDNKMEDTDRFTIKSYDVSIDKYITKYVLEEGNKNIKDDRKASKTVTEAWKAKTKNVVKVDNDSNVTYKIRVINKSANPVKVDVVDTLPKGYISVKSCKVESTTVTGTLDESTRKYTISNVSVTANSETVITLVVKVEYYQEEPVANTATIGTIKNSNDFDSTKLNATTDKTSSKDWHKIERLNIMMDKRIVKVENVNGTKFNSKTDRKNKTIDEKTKNSVKVEVGDIITYRIDVTTDSAKELNIRLHDKLPKNCTLITSSMNDNAKKLRITQGSNTLNTEQDFPVIKGTTKTITFKVRVENTSTYSTDYVNSIQLIKNTSGPYKGKYYGFIGKKDVSPLVWPKRGPDSDVYVVKAYNVSVEKYICSTNHYNATSRPSDARTVAKLKATQSSVTNVATAEAYKKNNPENVEVGDWITYKIVFSNTSPNGPVQVDKSKKPYYNPDVVYINAVDNLPSGASDVDISINQA